MRHALFGLSCALLAGCGTPTTTHELLADEVGRTVADVTLAAGEPHSYADMPDGRRAFRWRRASLVPTGGPVCLYTLYAALNGRPLSLAAWRVVAIDPPSPGCPPLRDGGRAS